MKKFLLLVVLLTSGLFKNANAQLSHDKCHAEIMFQEAAAKDPKVLQNREALEQFTESYINSGATSRASSAVKVIPVVVHVIHYGGAENISKAQIDDQIRTLNEDFQRLNPDTVNTPAAFVPVAGNVGIEFRLAQIDPDGNCTDGISRIYSPLTYNARNNVKSLQCWPREKYLNIWVVNSIANVNGSPGMVIGFAQFPGGADSTDGVVIKHDYMGSIGTAANSQNAGRTATHEVGHWLNLRHIWGDATCGTDFVSDTPTQNAANLSNCPAWPSVSACSGNAPNGDMFTNYMDYTNGPCQNMFSAGQAARMQTTLNSTISGRNNLWSASNLAATGTSGTPASLCAPIADFIPKPILICEGGSVQFNDGSWGAEVTSRTWTFNGGTPATDTAANPMVMYTTPGVYDVTLTVNNATGSNSKTIAGRVIVSASNVTNLIPFNEGFENGTWPFNDFYEYNANGGNTWATTTVAKSQGSKSLYIYNFLASTGYQSNDKGPDEFVTPAFNLTGVTAANMTFDLACALRDSTTDKLAVAYSFNCGQTWTVRYTRQGIPLQTTTGFVNGNFIPTAAQWRTETVNFGNTINNKSNVRFRFEFTHESSNNIYIDNININGTISGVNEINAASADMNIYPNPSKGISYVDFTMAAAGDVQIDVTDIEGRVVSTFSDFLPEGDHQYTMNNDLASGVYLVRLTFGNNSITKKAIIK